QVCIIQNAIFQISLMSPEDMLHRNIVLIIVNGLLAAANFYGWHKSNGRLKYLAKGLAILAFILTICFTYYDNRDEAEDRAARAKEISKYQEGIDSVVTLLNS